MHLVSQAKFAEMHGKSKQAISKWKARKLLVFQGSLVDVEKSNALLKAHLRDGSPVDKMVDRVADELPETVNLVDALLTDEGETIPEAARKVLEQPGALLSFESAKQLKENYLARLAQLEYDTKSGLVVDSAAVLEVIGSDIFVYPAYQHPAQSQLISKFLPNKKRKSSESANDRGSNPG